LFYRRRYVRRLVFHHAVDDVYKPPHDADQRLGFRFASPSLRQK
jgi:hypothetical protein